MTVTRVAVSGAAGQIAYSLLPLVARGNLLGADKHIDLRMLDIEPAMKVMEGVKAELIDCAFTLLDNITITADPRVAFKDVDVVILLGAFPRKAGMERKDLLGKNVNIFREQGAVLGEVAAPNCHVLVVGNPANTNALVLLKSSNGKLSPQQVTAMSRLDFNRLQAQIALHANVCVSNVHNSVVWGNHSSTMVPDVNSAFVDHHPARKAVNDDAFLDGPLIPLIQKRGAEIIGLRGLSSAMSAAKSAVDQMHDWLHGTPEGKFVCMSVYSTGNPYGIADDLMFSFPCTCKDGKWTIVKDINITPAVRSLIDITMNELVEEKHAAGIV